MRKTLFSAAVLGLTLLAGGVYWLNSRDAALACGDGPAIKLPALVHQGVVRGDQLHAISTTGNLITVDLKKHQAKDLGNFGLQLLPILDVADSQACLVSKGQLHLVDLVSGKVVKSKSWKDAPRAVGFIAGSRVYVHQGNTVEIVDLAEGKVLHSIVLTKATQDFGVPITHERVGSRLFVNSLGEAGVAIIDLEQGKLVEVLKTPDERIGGLHVRGDKVLVVGLRLGYGVWYQCVGEIDLTTKKYRVIQSANLAVMAGPVMVGTDDSMFISCDGKTYQIQEDGKLVPRTDPQQRMQLVGLWNGQMLLVNNGMLTFVPYRRTPVSTGN